MRLAKSKTYKQVLLIAAVNLLGLVTLIVLCEGAAHLVLWGKDVAGRLWYAESFHTEFDPLLGWVNRPGAQIDNFYGPGKHLRIDSRGFRTGYSPARDSAQPRFAIVCSGDSFTFGYGVDDSDTWCFRLGSTLGSIETTNMGQGAYGLDQAYLWYIRDGASLQHDMHIVAFISADFRRLAGKRFMGYPKPVLGVVDDSLIVTNFPLKKPLGATRWWSRYGSAFNDLAVVQFYCRLFNRPPLGQNEISVVMDEPQQRRVVAALLLDLEKRHRAAGRKLVLLYLPIWNDYDGEGATGWRGFLSELSKGRQWTYIDAVAPFKQLPRESFERMFITSADTPYPSAAGHYTPLGNRWVTDLLIEHLGLENLARAN